MATNFISSMSSNSPQKNSSLNIADTQVVVFLYDTTYIVHCINLIVSYK